MEGPIAVEPGLNSSLSTVVQHQFSSSTQQLIDDALAAAMDTSSLDAIDPSKAGGFTCLSDQEFRCELRSSTAEEPHGKGEEPQALQARLLVRGDPANPECVRIELTDAKDLFFYFLHELRAEDFTEVKDTQKLTCTWGEYLTVVQRLLTQTLREGTHFAILTKHNEAQTAKLWFIMNMEHKFVELLAAQCRAAPRELVQQMIEFRYKALQSKLALTQASLADVYALMRLRNPSLLRQLHGVAQRQPGQAPSSPKPEASQASSFRTTQRAQR